MSKVLFETEHRYAVESRDSVEDGWTNTGYYSSEAEARRESETSAWRFGRVIDLSGDEGEGS